eukprot:330221-Chlamydomonas_euryale.AAC.2
MLLLTLHVSCSTSCVPRGSALHRGRRTPRLDRQDALYANVTPCFLPVAYCCPPYLMIHTCCCPNNAT